MMGYGERVGKGKKQKDEHRTNHSAKKENGKKKRKKITMMMVIDYDTDGDHDDVNDNRGSSLIY